MKTQVIVAALAEATPGIPWKEEEEITDVPFLMEYSTSANHLQIPGDMSMKLAAQGIRLKQMKMKRTGTKVKLVIVLEA